MLRGSKVNSRHLKIDQDDAPISTDDDNVEKVAVPDEKLSSNNDTLVPAVGEEKSTDSNKNVDKTDDDEDVVTEEVNKKGVIGAKSSDETVNSDSNKKADDDDDDVEMEQKESEQSSNESTVTEGVTTESQMKVTDEKGVSNTTEQQPVSDESMGSSQKAAKVYKDDDDDDDVVSESKENESTAIDKTEEVNEKDLTETKMKSDDDTDSNKNKVKANGDVVDDDDGDVALESKESESANNEKAEDVNEKALKEAKSDDETVNSDSNKNAVKATDDDNIVLESKESETTEDKKIPLDDKEGKSGDVSSKPDLSDEQVNDGKKNIKEASGDDAALDLKESGKSMATNNTTDKKDDIKAKSTDKPVDEPDESLEEPASISHDGIEQSDKVATKINAIESDDDYVESKDNESATKKDDNGETEESIGSHEIKSANTGGLPAKTAASAEEVKNEGGNNDDKRDICKDDPAFLFKGLEGYDCDYIKANKPEKCLKSHDGFPVASWCPEACGAVEDCLDFKTKDGDEVVQSTDSNGGKYAKTDETVENDNSNEINVTTKDSDLPAKTATSTDEVKKGSTIDSDSDVKRDDICKDDPTFLLEGLEGYGCDYIRANKPEKCSESYKGFPIATWCPEACDVVGDCLDFKASERDELDGSTLEKESDKGSVSSLSTVSSVVESSQTEVDSSTESGLIEKAGNGEANENVTSTERDPENNSDAEYSNSGKGNTTTSFTPTGTSTTASTTTSNSGTIVEKSGLDDAGKDGSEAIDKEDVSEALIKAETEEVILGETNSNSSVPATAIKAVTSTEENVSANFTHSDTTQYEGSQDVGVDMSTHNSTHDTALNSVDDEELGSVDESEEGMANSKSDNTTLHADTNESVGEGEDTVEAVEEEKNLSSGSMTNGTKHHDEVESSLNTTDLEIDTSRPNCRDDPTFIFKDIEGYDCEYIKANKPEKCLKEHNGQKVGLVSCPQSCNMVEECLKEFGNNEVADSPAVQNVTSKVAVVDSDSLIAEDEQKDTLIDETNATSNAMANFTGTEDVDDESTSAGSIVGEEIHASSVSGGKTLASGDVDAGLSNAGTSGTTTAPDETLNAPFNTTNTTGPDRSQSLDTSDVIDANPSIISNCHDDPTFMFKDIEGYTCQYIKANKPQKCEKEHNGIMIGISSCPESCNMIDECLKAIGVVSSMAESNSNVTEEHENKSNAESSQEIIKDTDTDSLGENKTINDSAIDNLSIENTDAGAVSGDIEKEVEMEIENEIKYELDDNNNNTSSNVVTTTESTEQKVDGQWKELEKEAEQEFNNDNLAELEIENEIENEWKNENITSWAGVKTGDVAESDTNDDGGYGNMNMYGRDEDDEYDYGESPFDNEASWNNDNWNNDIGGTGAWDKGEVSSWGSENQGYTGYNEDSSAASYTNDMYQVGASQQESWNNPTESRLPAETWDDDEGFPVGIMLLILILLGGVAYARKNRQSTASQAGYQRVEQPMYMNKKS